MVGGQVLLVRHSHFGRAKGRLWRICDLFQMASSGPTSDFWVSSALCVERTLFDAGRVQNNYDVTLEKSRYSICKHSDRFAAIQR